MPEDKKDTGAPASDTTSALFVSARKKQIQVQEAERQAKEEEERRRAALEEARRLEEELAEKKRRAEEESLRLEEEMAEKKRQAEEESKLIAQDARARKEASAASPGTVPPAEGKGLDLKVSLPKVDIPKIDLGTGPKKYAIIAAVAVAVLVVGFFALSGGGESLPSPKDALDGNVTMKGSGLVYKYPTKSFKISSNETNTLSLSSKAEDAAAIHFTVFDAGYDNTSKLTAELKRFGPICVQEFVKKYNGKMTKSGYTESEKGSSGKNNILAYIGEGTFKIDASNYRIFIRLTGNAGLKKLRASILMAREDIYKECLEVFYKIQFTETK